MSQSFDPHPELFGQEFDGFRVGKYLGQGGSGPVYAGSLLDGGAPVVIKVFDIFGMLPEPVRVEFRKLLEDEAHEASAILHPSVAQVLAVSELEDMPCVISEFVEGRRLDEILTERGALPEPEAVALVRQVTGAVQTAHAAGLVHGDVKPGNVMVRPDGIPVLVDLGQAKSDPRLAALTRMGREPGTPLFQPPEQVEGAPATEAGDIYGLGATLLALCTGSGIGAEERARRLKANVSEPLRRVIRTAMAKDPGGRYPNSDALGLALDALPVPRPATGDDEDDGIEVLSEAIVIAPDGPDPETWPDAGVGPADATVADVGAEPVVDDATETRLDPAEAPATPRRGKTRGPTTEKPERKSRTGKIAKTELDKPKKPVETSRTTKARGTSRVPRPTGKGARKRGAGKLVAALVAVLLLAGGGFAAWYFTAGPGASDEGAGTDVARAPSDEPEPAAPASGPSEAQPPHDPEPGPEPGAGPAVDPEAAAKAREAAAATALAAAEALDAETDPDVVLAAFDAVVADYEGTAAAATAAERAAALRGKRALQSVLREGRVALADDALDDARAALERAQAIDAAHPDVVALATALAAAEAAAAVVHEIEALIEAGRLTAARDRLVDLPTEHPKHAALSAAIDAAAARATALADARALVAAGKWAQARAALEGLPEDLPAVAELLAAIAAGEALEAGLDRVRNAIELGNLDEAREALAALPADDPRVAELRAALEAATPAPEVTPKADVVAAALTDGEAALRDGRFSAVRRAVRDADGASDPALEKRRSALAEALDRAQGYWQDARTAAWEGRNRDAEQALAALARLAPAHPEARTLAETVRELPDGLRDDGESDGVHTYVNVADEAPVVALVEGRHAQGDANGEASEAPGPMVRVGRFYIDRYEVTNRRYARFLDWQRSAGNPHEYCHADEPADKDHTPAYWDDAGWADPELPVVGVDWFDAYAYARWAGGSLPTEAQWEAAARGDDDRRWPWGNDVDPYKANCADLHVGVDETPPDQWAWAMGVLAKEAVRTRAPGSFPEGRAPCGADDMAGNVWEWCLDTWRKDAYAVRSASDPVIEGSGWRVLRGGSWYVPLQHTRAANRWRLPASGGDAATGAVARRRDVGFRCVRNLE